MGNPTASLVASFRDRFGRVPTHLSRAPGRINLIGEHTDYNGLPVFPMAIQRAVRVALAPRGDAVVQVENVAPAFNPVGFEIAPDAAPGPTGSWGNYVRAPAVELSRRYGTLRGFDALVSSDLPVAAGLSSSSALVIAIGLALTRLNGLRLDDLELASVMADAERFTGTRGGGMDQAISLCAMEGHASVIHFGPLRLEPVPVPAGWSFVVAHSLSRAEKSGAAQDAYNRRGVECAGAIETVTAAFAGAMADRTGGSTGDSNVGALTAAQVGNRIPPTYPGLLAVATEGELMDVARGALGPVLLSRFRHVVTEAGRVGAARTAMLAHDLVGFGRLMVASHDSLRDDYEVSSPALDELVALAVEGGAAGARLTGAGFGGCVIALCEEEGIPAVLGRLRRFYRDRSPDGPEADRLFVAESSPGARFIEV